MAKYNTKVCDELDKILSASMRRRCLERGEENCFGVCFRSNPDAFECASFDPERFEWPDHGLSNDQIRLFRKSLAEKIPEFAFMAGGK